MKTDTILNSFTAGVLSPRLSGRTDITQYYQSANEILNMVIEFYGGAKKTPGTYFVAEVKNSSLSTRLKRFVFSDTQAYILEIGNQYIRFYKNGGAILETGINITGISQAAECVVTAANSYTDGDEVYISGIVGMTELNGRRFLVSDRAAGNFKIKDIDGNYIDSTTYTAWSSAGTAARVYTLATDYLTADIWDLQFAQKEDVLYITHPSYPQAELTRTGHTAWTIADIDYSISPAKPGLMPSNITTTTLTLADNTHPSVTLLASAALFDTATPSLHIGSIWKINSAKSVSADDWLESTAYTTANYVTFNDEIYFCVSNHTSGSSFAVDLAAGKWSLQDIYVKITAVADSTHATGNVLYGSRLEASPVATTTWSEGAWSAKRGYPKSVTIYESRLTYGYTPYQPQTTWESASGAYKTFKLGSDDSDATSYKADTNEVEVINWLFPANEILIGTVSGIHTLGTGSDSTAFTPTTTRIKKKSRDGTSSIMPQQIGNNVYYWQKYNRILREYTYSLDVDNFQTNDATAFSEHISESGIVDMDYQQSPIGVLWCVRADGKMASFTRQIEQKVAGWALHDTQGFYESVAVIPTTSYYDEVWFIVKRTVNGITRRYIEYMTAPDFTNKEDAFFVHSGLSLNDPIDITNATQTSPVVITAVNSFTDGQIVKIRGLVARETGAVPEKTIDAMEYLTDVGAQDAYVTDTPPVDALSATGGIITNVGNDYTHTFLGNGTFIVSGSGDIQVECWAGGGGGGDESSYGGGGGGGGGYSKKTVSVTNGNYAVTVGGAGARNSSGGNSTFASTTVIAVGGSGGTAGGAGGAGGTGGTGDTKYAGGAGYTKVDYVGGGGGGSGGTGSVGNSATSQTGASVVTGGGNGGNGGSNGENGSAPTIAPGGGGGGAGGYSSGGSHQIKQGGVGSAGKVVIKYTAIPNTDASLQSYSEPSIITQGSYSLKAIAKIGTVNSTLTRTISVPLDLSDSQEITFDIRASRTGSNISIALHDSGGSSIVYTPNILVADVFQTETIDISGITNANKDVIDSIIITILNADADNTFYIDNMFTSPVDAVTVGMVELNDQTYVITGVSGTAFSLLDLLGNNIDGTAFTAYDTGGEVIGAVSSVSGLRHLALENVQVFADGAYHPDRTVSADGVVTLNGYYSQVTIGLGYTARLKTNDLEARPGGATSQGKTKRVSEISANLYKSLDFKVGTELLMDTLSVRDVALASTEKTPLFTGIKKLPFPSGWATSKQIIIEQEKCLPFHILSIVAEIEVN